jgi:hypothetical protein
MASRATMLILTRQSNTVCRTTTPRAYNATVFPTLAFPTPLANSFILDSGATDHVYNNRARFRDYTKASADDYIVAGVNIVKIEG